MYPLIAGLIGTSDHQRTADGKAVFPHLSVLQKAGRIAGRKEDVRDYRGGSASGYLLDFTAAAETHGFKRIPAWTGWQKHYNRREFWHYQFDEGLTWEQAMRLISEK